MGFLGLRSLWRGSGAKVFHSLGAYDADASTNGCEDDRAVVSAT